MNRLLPLSALLAALPSRTSADGQRLHIRNGCDREPIWIAHIAAGNGGPDGQNVRIDPGEARDFATPDGLSATRYWPKMGCDAEGDHCALGGSGGPGQACVRRPPEVKKDNYSNCAPPVDTKFEGTFGRPDQPCTDAAAQGCDYVDVSLVDGWTLPFELKVHGACTGARGKQSDFILDCRQLTLDRCPGEEHLATVDSPADLRAIRPDSGMVAGCYSPCQRLVSDKWGQEGMDPASKVAAPYCCPTPPESPQACRSGPMVHTKYLDAVHGLCPGVYGYAYDDGMGLLRCVPTSIYELTFFCPDSTTTYTQRRTSGPDGQWQAKRPQSARTQQVKASILGSPLGDGSSNQANLVSGGALLVLAATAALGLPMTRHILSRNAVNVRNAMVAGQSLADYEPAPQSLDAPIVSA